MEKMEEIKYKVLELINKKEVKIPKMGFTDYYVHQQREHQLPSRNVSTDTGVRYLSMGQDKLTLANTPEVSHYDWVEEISREVITNADGKHETGVSDGASNDIILAMNKLSDQEVLESTEAIYFDENSNTGLHELKKIAQQGKQLGCKSIEESINVLKRQHRVISKKVLQLILEQRFACDEEFHRIRDTERLLCDTVSMCRSVRFKLDTSKLLLTTTNLEILAAYKKRQTLMNLLRIMNALKSMRSIDQRLQRRLTDADYGGAIAILLENKNLSKRFYQYRCVESLSHKLQDTLLLTEVQLESVLCEIPSDFEPTRYRKLQEAYHLLGKELIAMDQLHMNFISSVHTKAFTVLKQHMDVNVEESKKLTYEQMCECVPVDKYVHCLTALCRGFWKILASYHQIRCWHQNRYLYEKGPTSETSQRQPQAMQALFQQEYIQQKLDSGQFRLWNDVQSKVCLFISSSRLHVLKYDQFVQVLAIVQRLKKVGFEFCDSDSDKLLGAMQQKSMVFFKRYHVTCLEEISLFFDNEVWVPISSYHDVTQLQEYKNFRHAFARTVSSRAATATGVRVSPTGVTKGGDSATVRPACGTELIPDSASSMHSQDESSLYGSCGYFLRFNEKSSPFDGGFDTTMLEEDILAGIADESSYYFSEDSSENNEQSSNSPALVVHTHDSSTDLPFASQSLSIANSTAAMNTTAAPSSTSPVIVVNTTLTVLRCIGRYLYFCKLLKRITPHIVRSMAELIDYYIYSVHDLFSADLHVPRDNLYSGRLRDALHRINSDLLPILRRSWPLSDEMVRLDLSDPDSLYGIHKRIVATESCLTLIAQFRQMKNYLGGLLTTPAGDVSPQAVNTASRDSSWTQATLVEYIDQTFDYVPDLRKPIFMCSTTRIIELQVVLQMMAKVKWDINHVNVEHSSYIDTINRGIQYFAMKLEEYISSIMLPRDVLWDSFVHVLTHLLVEGFSNAKKCSAGGRALMQLDFTHFWSLLEIVSGGKHAEHRAYVEQYVKAYYLPKDLLEQWLMESNGYSSKHLIGLIQCACSSDKKTRQRLLALVENTHDHSSHYPVPLGQIGEGS